MDTHKIKKLLIAFYEGQTSKDEELLLLNYFSSNNIAEELMPEKDIFMHIHETDSIAIPQTLDSKLNVLIDNLDRQEKEKAKPTKTRKKQLWLWAGSAAACIAIAISITQLENTNQQIALAVDKVETKSITPSIITESKSDTEDITAKKEQVKSKKRKQNRTANIKPENQTISVEDRAKIQEAEYALELLSVKFNEGMNQLSAIPKNIDKTNKILDRTINKKRI